MKSYLSCLFVALGLVACASPGTPPPAADAPPLQEAARTLTGRNGIEGRILGRLVPGGSFERLEIGMSRNEVEQRIGPASEIHAHASGGGLIPFYPGSGWNTESHYIGEGRLWFSADSLLILIDAREPAR